MNKTELKAYNWLLSQGTREEDILLPTTGCDFIAKGKPFEAKRLTNRGIVFHRAQYDKFKETNPTILVFEDAKEEPTIVVPFSEIEGKIKFRVISHILENISITIEKEQLEWLEDQVREGKFGSISHGIRFALKELTKRSETPKQLSEPIEFKLKPKVK